MAAMADENAPVVKLIDCTSNPLDLSIASARTCYSSRGIVTPDQVRQSPADRELLSRLAASTLKAGHLTTRQHAQFVFTIDKVSRHFVWSFLHSHPYYNSEQVSQRYVEVKPGNFFIPQRIRSMENPRLSAIYNDITESTINLYKDLSEILIDPVSREFYRLFPGRLKRPEKWKSAIHKKTIEIARYVLPVSVHTYLYHTINGLTLHRYAAMMQDPDVPEEAAAVISRMIDAVRRVDPDFADEFPKAINTEEFTEERILSRIHSSEDAESAVQKPLLFFQKAARFTEQFDSLIYKNNLRYSYLESLPDDTAGLLTRSLHNVLGLPFGSISREDAVRMILSPSENQHMASNININIHSRISRILQNAVLVFSRRISHTADSQDQRHRTVPGARPLLMRQYSGRPDYITPKLIAENQEALEKYHIGMEYIFSKINQFLDAGGRPQEAVYLLPNAFPVRYTESGDLLSLRHKWGLRLCYNAQEEIFHASLEEVRQLEEREPLLKGFFRAPCFLRKQAGISPPCPEGSRFCGVKVWEKDLPEYNRLI